MEEWDWTPLFLTIKISFLSTIISLILGLLAAYFVVRMGKFKGVVDTVFTLPLVLPPTVVGFFILVLLGKKSWLGSFLLSLGIEVIFTPTAAVIAGIIVAFPLIYRTTRASFENLNASLMDAARTLGKKETWIFFRIVLPNAYVGILGGVVLAFARILGEFGATTMVSGNIPGKTQTISAAIYTAMVAGNRELAWKWIYVILGMSFLVLILLNGVLARVEKRRETAWN